MRANFHVCVLTAYRPMAFLDDLAANASAHNVAVVLYSGNDDSLVAHRGTEGAFCPDFQTSTAR